MEPNVRRTVVIMKHTHDIPVSKGITQSLVHNNYTKQISHAANHPITSASHLYTHTSYKTKSYIFFLFCLKLHLH